MGAVLIGGFIFGYYYLIVSLNFVNPNQVNDAVNKYFKRSFAEEVQFARANLLKNCPSLDVAKNVGVSPGSIDIVITTVNFSISTINKKAINYLQYTTDPDRTRNACEPRATVAGSGASAWKNKSFRCDHASKRSCCLMQSSSTRARKNDMWGQCVAPSSSNDFCRCTNCYDFRLRRPSMLYNEVRQQLRSFSKNGLHVKSKEHPNGIIRKIFIVYNEGTGNPAPTWLGSKSSDIVVVPHKTLWKAYGDMTGYPSENRNAIAAHLHRIPNLSEWFLYLEDDIFLNRPLQLRKNEDYITNDGKIVSYLNDKALVDKKKPVGGWKGAIWTTLRALEEKFGPRHSSSKSLVQGMENVLIGKRAGESEHAPRFFNKCVLAELWRVWPSNYAATVSHVQHTNDDFQIITHHGMFLEDLGLGKNIPQPDTICHEIHTLQLFNYENFLNRVCKFWKHKKIDWLQVQGDGISDEYISGEHTAMGNLRWAWQALTEAMWPRPSKYEVSAFGGKYYQKDEMEKQGIQLCKDH